MTLKEIKSKFIRKETGSYIGKEIYSLEPLINLHDPIFLAGPSRRPTDKDYKKPGWREDAVKQLRDAGFNGDIIIPEARDKVPIQDWNHRKQVDWETEGLHKAHRIFFWIPRSEELPAYTTNIEFGEWFKSGKIIVGWPNTAIRNDYLQDRLDKINVVRFHKIQEMVDDYMKYAETEPKIWFTSDTHFGQERTRQYSYRPFRNIEEMDLSLFSSFNKYIRQKDILIHLGDFGNYDALESLNVGKMLFFKGNYERKDIDNYKLNFLKKYSNIVSEISEDNNSIDLINPNNQDDIQTVYLGHEPTMAKGPKNGIYLFGHCHNRSMARLNGVDIGIDWQYRPLNENDIWNFINTFRNKYWDEEIFTRYVGEKYKTDHVLTKNELETIKLL